MFFHKALALKFYFFRVTVVCGLVLLHEVGGDVIKCYRITTPSPVLVDELTMIFTC